MKQHKYSSLGKAPYSLVNYFYDPPMQDSNGHWIGGNHVCDHCGRGISHVFVCRSSDGKTFNLGSVHVEYLGDDNLTKVVNEKVKEIKQEAKRQKIQAMYEERRKIEEEENKQRLTEVEKEFERIKPELEKTPHPNAYFAKNGKTMFDYLLYFLGTIEESWSTSSKLSRWHQSRVLMIMRQFGANV